MTIRRKSDFPVDGIRRFMEPGPVVLISSAHKGETGIMTCGWHMMMAYDTIGCFIWDRNHSRDVIRRSRECVINVPTADMAGTVVDIGNTSGADIDKFETFGLTRVSVTTMQAVSGAGYPGVPSLDILGNVVPYIGGGEEEKIETETRKILGDDESRAPHPVVVSAQVNRVPVIDGHLMTVSAELDQRPDPAAVAEAMRAFRGRPQELKLPTAPIPAINVTSEINRPQPRLDGDLGGGMTVSVGRVRACPVLTVKFVALGHNTIRGAAGASVLNAELMKAEGLLS